MSALYLSEERTLCVNYSRLKERETVTGMRELTEEN